MEKMGFGIVVCIGLFFLVLPSAKGQLFCQFDCANGTSCVPYAYRCDGEHDCPDGSDEDFDLCQSIPCGPGERTCQQSREEGKFPYCIPQSYWCDGEEDCPAGEDENERECDTCTDTAFQCRNGTCIDEKLRCNHKADCFNGEDEQKCDYPTCTADHYQCDSSECVFINQTCDGTSDCIHGDDERLPRCDPDNFQCAEDQFQCHADLKCLNWKDLCNEKNDCSDGSDELCSGNRCANHTCSHNCQALASGYECTCPDGYKLAKDKVTCIDINECTEVPGSCSQICKNANSTYSCACANGYTLFAGGKCNKNDDTEPYLLLANKQHTKKFTLENKVLSDMHAVAHDSVYLIDYDYKESRIYYADFSKTTINSVAFDGSDDKVINTHQAYGAEGVAFDWIAKNLYWTNRVGKCIYVSRSDGTRVKRYQQGETILPRGIAVDPRPGFGYVFWTDWSLQAFIGRMGMDGTNMTKIVKTDLFWPNDVTIDYTSQRIWWVDAYLDRIEYSDYDGNDRHVIKTDVPHVYAITNFGDYIYWTEWNIKRVEKSNKFTGEDTEVLFETAKLPYGIQVVHPLRQPSVNNPCGNNNGGCSDLCLIALGGNSFKCECPNYFVLMADGKTCQPNCTVGQFICHGDDPKCIPKTWECDGEADCGDKSDEHDNCSERTCPPGAFECKNSTKAQPECVRFAEVCNLVNDCRDKSDESVDMCKMRTCAPHQFQCTSGQCIVKNYECDGDHDCSDASDEDPKNTNCRSGNCHPEREFTCNNGKCIDVLWKCDWDDDCGDKSDEPHDECWANINCPSGWKQCRTNYRCIPESSFCDDNNDCRDNSDEEQDRCHACVNGDWTCANNRCIPQRWRCDREDDCGDNSDETDCSVDEIAECTDREWKCADNFCILKEQKCNHYEDCLDGSDELECSDHTCPVDTSDKSYFQCKSGHCIDSTRRCDRFLDCLDDQSDEAGCMYEPPLDKCVYPYSHECDSNVCIHPSWLCDGDNDCGDMSDEHPKTCANQTCQLGTWRCDNDRCVHNEQRCDGIDNCGDSSDENNHEYCASKKPTCSNLEYRCTNGECIDGELLCDRQDDCGDASDELSCHELETDVNCWTSTKKCSEVCHNITGGGYYCSCREGFLTDPDDHHKCKDINECLLNNGVCAQKCLNTEGGVKCECYKNFNKVNNGTGLICNANESTGPLELLVSTGRMLRRIVLGEEKQLFSPVVGQLGISAIDIDIANQVVYWTDEAEKKIKRGFLPSAKDGVYTNPQIIPLLNLNSPLGIAYDWYSNNIYYTDTGTRSISMARNDGNYVKTLLKMEDGIKPTYIAVNPLKGMMYWIEQTTGPAGSFGSLHSALLDGLLAKKLLGNLGAPADLAIDYYTGRVYWADPVTDTIESVDADGNDHHSVLARAHKPWSLDIYEGDIYFGSQAKSAIYRINKFGRGLNVSVQGDVQPPFALKIMHKFKQPTGSEFVTNGCAAGNCEALCITVPTAANTEKCLCPDGRDVRGFGGIIFCNMDGYVMTSLPKPPKPCECQNGGSCQMLSSAFVCNCARGFAGESCENIATLPPSTSLPPSTPQMTTPVTTVLPAKSTDPGANNAAAIAIPIVVVGVLLVIIFAVIFYLFRSGRLSSSKPPAGHATYRPGAPGGAESTSVNFNDSYNAPSIMQPSDESGIVNPTYDIMQQKEQIGAVGDGASPYVNLQHDEENHNENGNAEALPIKGMNGEMQA